MHFRRISDSKIKKDIRKRIDNGESKRAIFLDYAKRGETIAAARILASIPTRANMRKNSKALKVFLALFSLFAVIMIAAGVITCLIVENPFLPGLLSGLFVYGLTLYLMKDGNPAGFLMATAIPLYYFFRFASDISKGMSTPPIRYVLLPLLIIIPVYATVLHLKLNPKTAFFLIPKRNSLGEPDFED